MKSEPTVKRVLLRLPDGLFGRLRERAREEHRSINSQIVYLLKRGVTRRQARHDGDAGRHAPPRRTAE